MLIRSAKAKGKKLEKYIKDTIQELFSLTDDEIRVTIGAENGADVKLSRSAQKILPIKIEAKAREGLTTIYKFYAQAQSHEGKDLEPIVIIRSNRMPSLAILNFEYLMNLFKEKENNNGRNSNTR